MKRSFNYKFNLGMVTDVDIDKTGRTYLKKIVNLDITPDGSSCKIKGYEPFFTYIFPDDVRVYKIVRYEEMKTEDVSWWAFTSDGIYKYNSEYDEFDKVFEDRIRTINKNLSSFQYQNKIFVADGDNPPFYILPKGALYLDDIVGNTEVLYTIELFPDLAYGELSFFTTGAEQVFVDKFKFGLPPKKDNEDFYLENNFYASNNGNIVWLIGTGINRTDVQWFAFVFHNDRQAIYSKKLEDFYIERIGTSANSNLPYTYNYPSNPKVSDIILNNEGLFYFTHTFKNPMVTDMYKATLNDKSRGLDFVKKSQQYPYGESNKISINTKLGNRQFMVFFNPGNIIFSYFDKDRFLPYDFMIYNFRNGLWQTAAHNLSGGGAWNNTAIFYQDFQDLTGGSECRSIDNTQSPFNISPNNVCKMSNFDEKNIFLFGSHLAKDTGIDNIYNINYGEIIRNTSQDYKKKYIYSWYINKLNGDNQLNKLTKEENNNREVNYSYTQYLEPANYPYSDYKFYGSFIYGFISYYTYDTKIIEYQGVYMNIYTLLNKLFNMNKITETQLNEWLKIFSGVYVDTEIRSASKVFLFIPFSSIEYKYNFLSFDFSSFLNPFDSFDDTHMRMYIHKTFSASAYLMYYKTNEWGYYQKGLFSTKDFDTGGEVQGSAAKNIFNQQWNNRYNEMIDLYFNELVNGSFNLVGKLSNIEQEIRANNDYTNWQTGSNINYKLNSPSSFVSNDRGIIAGNSFNKDKLYFLNAPSFFTMQMLDDYSDMQINNLTCRATYITEEGETLETTLDDIINIDKTGFRLNFLQVFTGPYRLLALKIYFYTVDNDVSTLIGTDKINISDDVNPNDPDGRTYREIFNAAPYKDYLEIPEITTTYAGKSFFKRPNIISKHLDRVLISGDIEYPDYIQYSDTLYPEQYPATNTRPIEYNDNDNIIGFASLYDRLYIFKNNATYVIVGDVKDGIFMKLSDKYGAISKNSIVVINNYIYFMSNYGLCVLTGNDVKNISEGVINKYLLSFDIKSIRESFAVFFGTKNQYRLYIENQVLIYDIKNRLYFIEQKVENYNYTTALSISQEKTKNYLLFVDYRNIIFEDFKGNYFWDKDRYIELRTGDIKRQNYEGRTNIKFVHFLLQNGVPFTITVGGKTKQVNPKVDRDYVNVRVVTPLKDSLTIQVDEQSDKDFTIKQFGFDYED